MRQQIKLDFSSVFAMHKKRHGEGWTIKQIAQHFGSNDQHVGKILRGDAWKEVYEVYHAAETAVSPPPTASSAGPLPPNLQEQMERDIDLEALKRLSEEVMLKGPTE